MPMKTFKGSKNNKVPQIRRNVKKGTLNKLEAEIFRGTDRDRQIANSHIKKYTSNGNNYNPFENLKELLESR